MRILLVSPRTPSTFWSLEHALAIVSKRAANPPLGLITVAAMLPGDWEIRLADLDVRPLEDEEIVWSDFVMVGAMIVHGDSVREITRRCHALGRRIIAGGPLFTTNPDAHPDIDHFVIGEAEDVIGQVIEDIRTGELRRTYRAEGFPSLEHSPIPRWDLLELDRYASMSVQFSRGCPYDCEFCDIVVLNGRVPRTKPAKNVIAELDALHRVNWRGVVFIVDDNFVGNRRRARELLSEIIRWRRHANPQMDFVTEASVDLGRHHGLLGMMVEAGFKKVFLGLETPVSESLQECEKYQNLRGDLSDTVARIQKAGLEVMGGFIVGFDHDPLDVFRRQFLFIQDSGVVTAMVGLLTALPGTRLYERLKMEGRLLAESSGNNTAAVCNFVPRLGRGRLVQGYRKLMLRLYESHAYYARARVFLGRYRVRGPQRRMAWEDVRALCRANWTLGIREKGRLDYWFFLAHVTMRNPRAIGVAVTLAVYGRHFRRMASEL
jgi:radical SAM superfamily enzyme YgiQ (UPF0313 family)